MHAGEKVGLVGRNGVGKTTLLQVLAGLSDPAGGVVLRRGRMGYLRQDPKVRRGEPGTVAVAHVMEGRGLAEAGHRLEKLLRRQIGFHGEMDRRFRWNVLPTSHLAKAREHHLELCKL